MNNDTSKNESVRGDDGKHFHAHGRIMQPPATEEMVEQRARKLALIAGREPNHASASDRIQAKRELLGDDASGQAVDEANIVSTGMGAPPVSRGQQVKNHLPTDDKDETDMVQEGVDQAGHEQSLEAAKSRTSSEG